MQEIPVVGGRSLPTNQMGITLTHEHLRTESDGVRFQWPHIYDTAWQTARALEEVQKAQSYGISTICDPTVMGLGRDIHFMENIVEQTGIQLVAATGLYTYHDIPHFFENRSIDFMADLFVHDIEEGIQGSDTRAGFIKFATDEPGITPAIQKVISAGARAHRRTGVPIITHSHAHNGSGAEQQRLLEAEGVDLRRVVIGHAGDTDDVEYLVQLLERGSFIGLDRYGLDIYLPTARRNVTVVELIARGYIHQLMLSQDACATIDWFEPEQIAQMVPDWNMSFIPAHVLPALKSQGITDEQIQIMMVDNPRRLFEMQGAY